MAQIKLFTKLGNRISKEESEVQLKLYINLELEDLYVHKSHNELILYYNGRPRCMIDKAEEFGFKKDYQGKWKKKSSMINGFVGIGIQGYFENKVSTIYSLRDNVYFLNQNVAISNGYVRSNESRDWIIGVPTVSQYHKLAGYHSGLGRENLIGNNTFGIGIEVEKEDSSFALDYEKVLRETKWIGERDGSLGDGGFELISPAIPLDVTKNILNQSEWIEKYINPVGKYLNASYSDRCGG